jgi:hypothetical protein
MSLKRSLKSFALANTVAAFAISLPVSAQGVADTPFGDDPVPQAAAENIEFAGATRQLPAKNSLYVPNPSEPIRVQLMKFNGTSASEMAGTSLAVAGSDGSVTRYRVNEDGAVIFKVEKSGLYAFITSGPMGHAAFPVVIRLESQETGEPFAGGAAVAVPTISLPIFTLGAGEPPRAVSSFVPPNAWTWSDIDVSPASMGDITATVDFRVNLSETGRMEGQVVSLMRDGLVKQSIEGNNLLLYRDGELVARSISDPLGRFAFEELAPGAYGIICAGPGGYAAFAFEAVMPALSASLKNGETLVATKLQQAPTPGPFSSGDVLPIVPIPSPAVPGLLDLLRSPEEGDELPLETEAAFAPVPGGGGAGFGGPGGGFGSGGGGGGGMGGAGGLLGLAGLGIAAAAAASDSNDRVIVNPTPDDATPANVLP